ncbi:MAG: PEP/pyruvate-binding domain-containing protein [Rikenellaceae bacterium]
MKNSFKNRDFSSLMQSRVNRILLISSPYELFTLEEDGHLEEQLTREYNEFSLSNPPHITRADNGHQALEVVKTHECFDLIISLYNIGDMSAFELAHQCKLLSPKSPFVLLTSFSHEITRQIDTHRNSSIDYIFAWQGNSELLLAIIKMIEDKANAQHDMLEYGVQGILLVEDSIRFYSAYLTDLYNIIITQTNDFAKEAFNLRQQKQRKRSRPRILFADNYTQAKEIYDQYATNLLGVISDVTFKIDPKDSESKAGAGIDLCREIQKNDPKLPILLQSSDSLMREVAQEIGIDFIDKNSKTILREMQLFINRRMAFGSLSFVDPTTEVTVAKAHNLAELQQILETLPTHIITYYSKQNMFSKWLYARGLFQFAQTIKTISQDSFDDPQGIRRFLVMQIENFRRQAGQGVVAEFDPLTYNKYITFSRSGNGSLGGKARGLAFISNLLEQHNIYHKWDNVLVTIPRTFVASTEHFDRFMEINSLQYIMSEQLDDSEILSEFMSSRLDESLIRNVFAFIQEINRPVAVRSSSLLEDSHYQPFAGIYSTYMVPYDSNKQKMCRLVTKAIKAVYASVYYASSRQYIEATGNLLSEEKMAIVIQELCGSSVGDLYYPTLSGNARSVNFYPLDDELPQEGVCHIAMGLGRAVMDGGQTLRFSPSYPRNALQLSSPDLARRDSQRYIYALEQDASKMKTSTDESINLRKVEVNDLKDSPHMRYVSSTWEMQNNRMSDSPFAKGRKVLTFAPILKYDLIPLAEIIRYLLDMGRNSFHNEVEIEFALNMDVEKGDRCNFNLLQIRPIVSQQVQQSISWQTLDKCSSPILRATKALGRGEIKDIQDIIFINPHGFDASQTPQLAQQIAQLNQQFETQKKGYILIGPGRWGSSDPWLGIPVRWSDISAAKVIVECGSSSFQVDPSQGTHFFQNITSFGVGYITINPDIKDGELDFERLTHPESKIPNTEIYHTQFESPLTVVIDAVQSKAIIKE